MDAAVSESCHEPGTAHRARNCMAEACRLTNKCNFTETPVPAKVTDFAGKVDGGGYKASMDDPRKVKLWLVPFALVYGVARVLMYGMNKYAANNWRKGMNWSEVYDATLRHLHAWNEGEDNDPESGLSHLWHAACNLAFLCEYAAFAWLYGGFDNRFKRPIEPKAGV